MDARGFATTFFNNPEIVLRPVEIIAQQGASPNCPLARSGTNATQAVNTATVETVRHPTTVDAFRTKSVSFSPILILTPLFGQRSAAGGCEDACSPLHV